MQDNLLEMWQSFQAQHGTISNLRKIVPTEPLTRKDLLAVIQYPLDFSENEAVISAENVQDQEIKIFLASEKIKISLDIEKINQLKDLIESDKFFEQPKIFF
ncbi:MAG: hypothetical protein HWD59_12985 [Coxiellaceae bacterium]|nr:MAG: hypothetical protein HWD59_12985 [Coxiellaceae bacterium]